MSMKLANVTVNDAKAYARLVDYLYRISSYKNFDESMLMNVYVDNDGDLIGFDSQRYRIQYVNNAHKLKEISLSSLQIEPMPFSVLKSHLLKVNSDMPF